MKIFSAERTRELDAYTIASESIYPIDLMERASHAFVDWFRGKFGWEKPVQVFCGNGNNGGDGLAIARILTQKGYEVSVFVVQNASKASADFLVNLDRLRPYLNATVLDSLTDFPVVEKSSIVVDALLGSGLSRPVSGFVKELILHINASGAVTVSVDIASGLKADTSNHPGDCIVEPDYTVSFQLPKLAFMMPQNEPFTGAWTTVDIRLSRAFIEHEVTPYQYVDEAHIRSITKKRQRFSHKGTFGHALIIAGSYGKIGAAVLAGKACLRSGAGLITLSIPRCGYHIMQSVFPEAMVVTDPEPDLISDYPDLSKYASVGVGPGLGTAAATVSALHRLLSEYRGPLVLDADALNILAAQSDWLDILPENSILTPHPKEFERLAGESSDHFSRLEKLRKFASRYRVIVCLKGANTAIALPDGSVFFNSTGNAGMATAGSGDVLTGMITGLLAQGYRPEDAAILGVYKHGMAGDKASEIRSEASIIATDIIDTIR